MRRMHHERGMHYPRNGGAATDSMANQLNRQELNRISGGGGMPSSGYPPQGPGPQGYQAQAPGPQGYPPQAPGPQGYPPPGYGSQGYPPQGPGPQGYPPPGYGPRY
jgi:hypothetical protein